jgi:hypothetical protein
MSKYAIWIQIDSKKGLYATNPFSFRGEPLIFSNREKAEMYINTRAAYKSGVDVNIVEYNE